MNCTSGADPRWTPAPSGTRNRARPSWRRPLGLGGLAVGQAPREPAAVGETEKVSGLAARHRRALFPDAVALGLINTGSTDPRALSNRICGPSAKMAPIGSEQY
jgi:hypothetical protein